MICIAAAAGKTVVADLPQKKGCGVKPATLDNSKVGRDERIRTSGPLNPIGSRGSFYLLTITYLFDSASAGRINNRSKMGKKIIIVTKCHNRKDSRGSQKRSANSVTMMLARNVEGSSGIRLSVLIYFSKKSSLSVYNIWSRSHKVIPRIASSADS